MPDVRLRPDSLLKTRHILLSIVPLLFWCAPSTADVIAKANSWTWHVSVISKGDAWSDTCALSLLAETYQLKREISLKQQGNKCALFGPVQLLATDSANRETTYVYFEAARGGDGDHSGPIVEIFQLTKQGLRKLGEQQLFEASYHRTGETLTAVTGKVLFGFCYMCDGPAGPPEENIFVPVRVTAGCGGICVKPTMGKQDRDALLTKFTQRKAKDIETYNTDKRYQEYVDYTEKRLREFLAR